MRSFSFRQLFVLFFIACVALLVASALSAWTGPTATAPAGNVAAPINVGTTDQVKNAGISVNALAVFGGGYVQTKLGVGVASPVVAIETPGTIKIGSGGEVCQAVTEGAIRYNTTLNTLSYCDGSAWVTLAVAETPSSQSFTTPGTYSFTVPNYSSMTVTMKAGGGGGGGPFNTGGPAGTSGGNSSFNGTSVAYGGGGGGAGTGPDNGGFFHEGENGAAGGGTGGTVTTGGGGAGGAGQYSSRYGQFPWGHTGSGGSGGAGGKVIKTYATGDLSSGTIVTVVVGAGGGGASSGGAGSVEIALTY